MDSRKRNLLTMGVIVAGLGVFAWLNDLPHSSKASSGPMDDYVLYGIEAGDSTLVRYGFAEGSLSRIGQVRNGDGDVLSGIGASAYIPGFTNIYGFWRDPSDVQSKLLYINAQTARASVVGATLGTDQIGGAAAVNDGSGWAVYAVQQPALLDFDIVGGRVIPSTDFAVKVTVLGADITYGGSYEQPVTVKVQVGSSSYEPFGAFGLARTGNIHDHTVHESVINAGHSALDQISVVGQTWTIIAGENGSHDNEWEVSSMVASGDDPAEVIVLRDGDAVPSITPFLDQAEIADFIVDYIDVATNTVDLGANQAIYLFELGSGGAASTSADFQDLVVLVTLAGSEPEFTGGGTYGVMTGRINLNPNNNAQREFTLTMSDKTVYTRDDLHESSVVGADGTFCSGYAKKVRFAPKGPGSQNELSVDGVTYEIVNSDLYTVVGQAMSVRVYNDLIDGDGKAMGHWWLSFTDGESGTVYEGEAPVGDGETARLVKIDHKTGALSQVMPLEYRYDGLASADGVTLYGTSGSVVYELNTATLTETMIGVISGSAVRGMDYAGMEVMCFDSATDQIAQMNPSGTSLIGSASGMGGAADLETIIFVGVDQDPANIKYGFD